MNCKHCNSPIKEGVKYCTFCGKEVVLEVEPSIEVDKLKYIIEEKKSELQNYLDEKKKYDDEIQFMKERLIESQKKANEIENDNMCNRHWYKYKKYQRKRETNAKLVISPIAVCVKAKEIANTYYDSVSKIKISWDHISIILAIIAILNVFTPFLKIVNKEFNHITIWRFFVNLSELFIDEIESNLGMSIFMFMIILFWISIILYVKYIFSMWQKSADFIGRAAAITACTSVCLEYIVVGRIRNELNEKLGGLMSIFSDYSDYDIRICSSILLYVLCSIGIFAITFLNDVSFDHRKKYTNTIVKPKEPVEKYIVNNYQPTLPVRIVHVILEGNKKDRLTVEVINYKHSDLRGIVLDIDLQNTFGDIFRITECQFAKPMTYMISTAYHAERMELLQLPWDGNICGQIKCVRVYVKRLIYTDVDMKCDKFYSIDIPEDKFRYIEYIRKQWGDDALNGQQPLENDWLCACGCENKEYMSQCWMCKREKQIET